MADEKLEWFMFGSLFLTSDPVISGKLFIVASVIKSLPVSVSIPTHLFSTIIST